MGPKDGREFLRVISANSARSMRSATSSRWCCPSWRRNYCKLDWFKGTNYRKPLYLLVKPYQTMVSGQDVPCKPESSDGGFATSHIPWFDYGTCGYTILNISEHSWIFGVTWPNILGEYSGSSRRLWGCRFCELLCFAHQKWRHHGRRFQWFPCLSVILWYHEPNCHFKIYYRYNVYIYIYM